VEQDSTVAGYQAAGRADIADIARRGRRAVVVGGSGLYVRALLDELDFPGTDPEVRASLEERAERHGTAAVFDELVRLDPVAAERIGPRNTRRIVRALEVIELTGAPYSASLPTERYAIPAVQLGLEVPREVLDERIAARVDRMWAAGLVDEVRDLAPRLGRTAERAVGYAEVLSYLRGERTEAEARDSVTTNTRRLVRRQQSWFRRDSRIQWLDATASELVGSALEVVAATDRRL